MSLSRYIRWTIACTAVLSGVVLGSGTASATPTFARQTGQACSSCHMHAWPELSPAGWAFKERGYQLPPSAEAAADRQDMIVLGDEDDHVELWRTLPLSLRAQGSASVAVNTEDGARNAVDLGTLDNLFLIAGGSFHHNASFYAAASVAPQAGLHHGSFGLHNLLGDRTLSVRAGQLLLLDFVRPDHRRMVHAQNLVGLAAVGLNPTVLDSSQLGLDAYGRPFCGPLFWRVAVVQGSQQEGSLQDGDSFKDFFGELQVDILERHKVGALAYLGRTQITDDTRNVAVRFTDPFWQAAVHGTYTRGPLSLFGMGLYGRHKNPYGTGDHASYVAARVDADLAITRTLMTTIRYDRVHSDDDAALDAETLTAHLSWLLLGNFRLGVEYQANLVNFDASMVFGHADLAL